MRMELPKRRMRFGPERLVEACTSADGSATAMNRRLMEEVARFCHGHFRDDVTVVALAIR